MSSSPWSGTLICHGEPVLVLGGGSDLVVADAGFAGTVIRAATSGIASAGR